MTIQGNKGRISTPNKAYGQGGGGLLPEHKTVKDYLKTTKKGYLK